MKKIIIVVFALVVFASCANDVKDNPSVGDSLRRDPQTGQPVYTAPDTMNAGVTDTTTNQNHHQ